MSFVIGMVLGFGCTMAGIEAGERYHRPMLGGACGAIIGCGIAWLLSLAGLA